MKKIVRLEVMSSIPSENCSGMAEIIKNYKDGTTGLHLIGTKRDYSAWRRPGGEEDDFVCGALAPGDPLAAHPNADLKTPGEPKTKESV